MHKILMISTTDIDKNGITTCILNYFNLLAGQEFHVDILAPNHPSKEIREQIEEHGMQLLELPTRKKNTMKYFFSLRRIISKGNYDIVHAHGNSCTLAIELLAAKLANCKIRIAHSHNTTCEHMKAHRMLRPIFELCCNGRFACGEEAGKWLFPNKSFSVIRNGINLNNYHIDSNARKSIRKKYNIEEDELLLGHVGYFNEQKNHAFLLEILKRIKGKKMRMLLLGEGHLMKSIQALAKEYGVDNQIIFAGNVDNVPDYLQAMDIFLLPSKFEGLPFVLVETQAAGVPCIVSDKVSVESKMTSLVDFIPLSDVSVWVKKIEEKQNEYSYSGRDDRVREAHKRIEESGYSIVQNAEYVKDLYRGLIKKKRHR